MSIHYIIGNLNVYSKSFFGLFHAFILKMNEFNENMVTACMTRVPSLRKNIRSKIVLDRVHISHKSNGTVDKRVGYRIENVTGGVSSIPVSCKTLNNYKLGKTKILQWNSANQSGGASGPNPPSRPAASVSANHYSSTFNVKYRRMAKYERVLGLQSQNRPTAVPLLPRITKQHWENNWLTLKCPYYVPKIPLLSTLNLISLVLGSQLDLSGE